MYFPATTTHRGCVAAIDGDAHVWTVDTGLIAAAHRHFDALVRCLTGLRLSDRDVHDCIAEWISDLVPEPPPGPGPDAALAGCFSSLDPPREPLRAARWRGEQAAIALARHRLAIDEPPARVVAFLASLSSEITSVPDADALAAITLAAIEEAS